MNVRIYVEGGGDSASTKAACREGFSRFMRKAVGNCRKPRVIACGGRQSAYEDFMTALEAHKDDFVVLLVDSEDAVAQGHMPWQHLQARDNWVQPTGVPDESAQLMVRCMETWLVADRSCLREFYGAHLHENALPAVYALEDISKEDVQAKLTQATRGSKPYHKTRHGFQLLGSSDPAVVASACPSCQGLIAILRAKLCDTRFAASA